MPISASKSKMNSSRQNMPAKLRLKLCNETENLMSKTEFTPENKSYGYHLLHSKEIDGATFGKLFVLFESLMRYMYEKSDWGWNEKEKMDEWKHPKTKILIVTKCSDSSKIYEGIKTRQLPDPDEMIVGFMCFRFEVGAGKNEVALYVYELHVDPGHQRQGLGENLMKFAKVMAVDYKMDKVMLTVFRSNAQALQFYKKLNFKPDKSSPTKDEADYTILSIKL